MIGAGGKSLRLAYQKAFEESFVENYDVWNDALTSINSLIEMINDELDGTFKTYSYDQFCCLAKNVVDNRMERVDWDKMVADEDRKRKHEIINGTYSRNSKQRIKHSFQTMESDVFSMCFEKAMKIALGEKTYNKFKTEIEKRNNEVVL